MVHALEKIHSLIAPGGVLLDIHPSGQPASIEVRIGSRVTPAGWLHETDDYVEYGWADEALARVIESGLFAVERTGAFEFVTHAATILELRDFLTEGWEDASIDDITVARVDELFSTPERDKEVILRESIKIARLKRMTNAEC